MTNSVKLTILRNFYLMINKCKKNNLENPYEIHGPAGRGRGGPRTSLFGTFRDVRGCRRPAEA